MSDAAADTARLLVYLADAPLLDTPDSVTIGEAVGLAPLDVDAAMQRLREQGELEAWVVQGKSCTWYYELTVTPSGQAAAVAARQQQDAMRAGDTPTLIRAGGDARWQQAWQEPAPTDVFAELRAAIQAQVGDRAHRDALTRHVDALDAARQTDAYPTRYHQLVIAGRRDAAVLEPFWPRLRALLHRESPS
jgi:hypothetical protein